MAIDFSNIKEHDGSRDKGFEELVCQLAHLQIPENAMQFIRKEGDGGDAGVECYWKLDDDSEHAWQAKYFLSALTTSQWSQITHSVKTAIDKHPKLSKYYVCVPRDLTDSRKESNGKPVTSAFDKWEVLKKEWNNYAAEKGMKVDFIYWGKHEICHMLQTDHPSYSGKVLYWFTSPSLTTEKLITIASRSKESLGDRFTPEYHVDLPIAEEFHGLGKTIEWFNTLDEKYQELNGVVSKISSLLSNEKEADYSAIVSCLHDLEQKFHLAVNGDEYSGAVAFAIELDEAIKSLWRIEEQFEEDELKKVQPQNAYVNTRKKSTDLRGYIAKLSNLKDFVNAREMKLSIVPSMLLLGEAGIGKSHLLCDIVLRRLEKKLPTLFLLGQSYTGGNPIDFLKSELGLDEYTNDDILSALDAFGECKGNRLLIVIDAINEGKYKDEWYDQIQSFISRVQEFKHIGIALSCRSTYKAFLIPDELNDDLVTFVRHTGFSGHEHKAAMIYLAGNGISAPNAPILNPEFSNPLFLKTCVKAIKNSGETSFPKGLNGFVNLFDFYTKSIDSIVKRKKKCRSKDNLILKALSDFVKCIFPDKIHGLTYDEAAECINNHDPNPGVDTTLLEILLAEGVLSTDISYAPETPKGFEVIRFTYERFSDFFMALYIIDGCSTIEELESSFKDGSIAAVLVDEVKYRLSGVIQALGIIIPEKFNREFIEFYTPKDEYDESHMISITFHETILWRTGSSISEKSLKLINTMSSGYYNSSLEVLIALSIEKEHPWNAEFLSKHLINWEINVRDSRWSTFVAVNDSSDANDYESVVRKIVDWAYNYDLTDIDEGTLWLTALILSWFTSTSNRKTRDQATKSLSLVLKRIPNRIIELLEHFAECDDCYIVQRLYGAVYGTITSSCDAEVIGDVAKYIIDIHFAEGSPYPDLLFRDYICGIVEYAFNCGAINIALDINDFRPPFKSKWPLDNPTKEEINKLESDEYSSIRSSIMGFPGDFGNYTMSCIHNWAARANESGKGVTGIEAWREFAIKLPESLRDEYNDYIEDEIADRVAWNNRDIDKWLEAIKSGDLDVVIERASENNDDLEVPKEKKLKEKIEDSLDDVDKEEFRWLSGIRIDEKVAPLSRKWSQRWVYKRAISFGWSKELFEWFENVYCNSGRHGRTGGKIERIGKKYQWIAFHEILARISDNLPWIDRGYSDLEDSSFYGPWQMHRRDIDPTIHLRKTNDNGWLKNAHECWWSPYKFSFSEFVMEELNQWLWSTSNLPNFKDIIAVDDEFGNRWLALKGFVNWNRHPLENKREIPYQDAWYRINTCIVHKDDLESILAQVNGQSCASPDIIGCPSTDHQGFYGEYPWHRYYSYINDWENDIEKNYHRLFDERYHIPVCQYDWEGGVDHSIDESLSFYMPSPFIIRELNLSVSNNRIGHWLDKKGDAVFFDPSIYEKGPSFGLIKKEVIQEWLDKNDCVLLYLIGGEKQMFTEHANIFFGRHVFSGAYYFDGDEMIGDTWFIEERPHKRN
ncbi:MAG: hypothetical protein RBR71_07115 [Gudongella sp.]|nr:hypothetical protein [Gudongella sp.]